METKLILTHAGAVVVGTVIGGGLGYLITKRKLSAEFEAKLDHEMDKMYESFQRRHKEGPFATVESAARELLSPKDLENIEEPTVTEAYVPKPSDLNELRERIQKQKYDQEQSDEFSAEIASIGEYDGSDEPVVQSLWDRPKVEESEPGIPAVIRDPNRPFLIPIAEFMGSSDEPDYEHTSLTYYAGDDTLADERDEPIPDGMVDELIGRENLSKFGVGTTDKDQFYVRNDRVKTYFEVTRDQRTYPEGVGQPHEESDEE